MERFSVSLTCEARVCFTFRELERDAGMQLV
jgi:hypothetical protein